MRTRTSSMVRVELLDTTPAMYPAMKSRVTTLPVSIAVMTSRSRHGAHSQARAALNLQERWHRSDSEAPEQ